MPTYRIKFSGRKAGALGVYEDFEKTVTADSEEAAVRMLYDVGYEHIMVGVPAEKRSY